MPVASTPTARRVPCSDAAAMPQSVTISCVARPVTGVRRWIGHCARIQTSARSAPWRSTTRLRDVLGEHLDEQRLALDDELDRLLEELGEARHVDALLVGGEVDRAVDDRGHHRLGVAAADAHRLLHAGDAGARERERDLGRRRLEIVRRASRRRSRGHRSTAPPSAIGARAAGP